MFPIKLVLGISTKGYYHFKIWNCSMFFDPALALSYQTGSIPWSICLIWVWSETFAILSWVWVWSTSKTGMRGVKIWHCLMFSDPAVALSYQIGSIPWLICLIWVWLETFAILSWVWVWSTSETGMRGAKIWHSSMIWDPAMDLSYRTGSIPWSICLIWVWFETFAILSKVWVWSTTETGMRGVKIWHRLMFSDPIVALSYQTGSIPW